MSKNDADFWHSPMAYAVFAWEKETFANGTSPQLSVKLKFFWIRQRQKKKEKNSQFFATIFLTDRAADSFIHAPEKPETYINSQFNPHNIFSPIYVDSEHKSVLFLYLKKK